MMGWQRGSGIGGKQVICTKLHTDNHTSIALLRIFIGQMLSLCQPNNSMKALKACQKLFPGSFRQSTYVVHVGNKWKDKD